MKTKYPWLNHLLKDQNKKMNIKRDGTGREFDRSMPITENYANITLLKYHGKGEMNIEMKGAKRQFMNTER